MSLAWFCRASGSHDRHRYCDCKVANVQIGGTLRAYTDRIVDVRYPGHGGRCDDLLSASRRSAWTRPGLDATARPYRWQNPFSLHTVISGRGSSAFMPSAAEMRAKD
jgi:hypothetical protein